MARRKSAFNPSDFGFASPESCWTSPLKDRVADLTPGFGGLHPTDPSDPLFPATLSLSVLISLNLSHLSLTRSLISVSLSPSRCLYFRARRIEKRNEEGRRKKKKIIKRREVYRVILKRRGDIIYIFFCNH
jgi:hypothetical protein